MPLELIVGPGVVGGVIVALNGVEGVLLANPPILIELVGVDVAEGVIDGEDVTVDENDALFSDGEGVDDCEALARLVILNQKNPAGGGTAGTWPVQINSIVSPK